MKWSNLAFWRKDSGVTDAVAASLGKNPAVSDTLHENITRYDGWQNQTTGIGTWDRDKAQHLEFRAPWETLSLDYLRLRILYHYDPLSRKIIETVPKHMFRRGWDFEVKGDKPDSETHDAIVEDVKRLHLVRKLYEASVWGRCYGGALAIFICRDGLAMDQPLNETSLRSVDCINVQDRRYAQVVRYYSDIEQPNFGEPELYRVWRYVIGPGTTTPSTASPAFYDVHESRVIRFEGDHTDIYERQRLGGWSHSVLQAPYEEIKRFMQVFQSAAHLLTDASQGVYKLKGLMQQLSSKQGKAVLEARMAMVDMARSVARSLLLDADGEEFNRVQTAFTSVPELLDRFMQMLSMVTGIPVTILMGRSAAGMNATGDSDFRAFYDEIASSQTNDLEPKLRRAYRLIMLAKTGPTKGVEKNLLFTFRPLWNPTDKERADTNYVQAQADALYVTNQVLSPEEVALSRFKNGQTNLTTVVDLKAREGALEDGVSFDAHPNDPEPETEGKTESDNATGPAP